MNHYNLRRGRLAAALIAAGVLGAPTWAQEADPMPAAPLAPLRAPALPASAATSDTPAITAPAPAQPASSGAPATTTPSLVAPAGPAASAPALSAPPAASAPVTAAPAEAVNRDAPAAPKAEVKPDAKPEPKSTDAATPREPAIVGTEIAPPAESVVDAPTLHEDLWGRVRRLYGIADLESDLVRKWEVFYTQRPEYLQRMFDRGGRYLFHIVEEVDKRGMPSELALLPFIESAFNPHATSSARASGIWQFMPATGKHFDLRQNIFRDDRRSVLDSTRAALDYLQQLHGMFGDWRLALAAYNWGQGNVARAQAKNRQLGRGTEYTDLPMPDETRNYVPKLQAIANLVERPDQFGVQLPPLQNHPYFLTVKVDRDIDVALVTRLAGLDQDEFQALNPQMNKPVILAAGTPQLLLPFDSARRYQREIARHQGPLSTWTAWIAPRTLKPAEAARTVGMSEDQLRSVNRIPPRMLVKAGSTLLVPRSASMQRDVSEHVADTASISLAPEASPGRKRTVRAAAKGETVAALARRYKVSPAQLASWNGVPANGSFKGGQNVVLFSAPQRATASAKSRPAGSRVATAKAPAKVKASAKAPAPRPVRVAKR